MSQRPSLRSRLLLTTGLAVLAVVALGCSSSSKTTTGSTTTPATSGSLGTTQATTAAPATGAPTSGVSGSWSGHYSGAFTGTFNLTWVQSGSNLSGTITISGFGNTPTNITGTLQGNSIRFGTVGSQAVTYTGSVSGSSMSGTWQIQAARNPQGGSWDASKTS